MREGWKTVKLGDLASIKSGKGIKKSEYIEGGKYAIIGANGEIGRCNDFNNELPVLTTGRVGTIGTIQKVEKAWITDNVLVIDIVDNSVDYSLLFYTLKMVDFKSITTGNAQPLVTAGRLKEVEITIPESLEEQKRIAQVLSDLDSLGDIHSQKVINLTKVKEQLMSNKSGIIEKERIASQNVKCSGDKIHYTSGEREREREREFTINYWLENSKAG